MSPTDANRRRAERIRFAIRVRVNVTCEGMLVDLSESGAMLRLPRAQEPQKQVTVAIESEPPVHLAARVVRCTPGSVQTESAQVRRIIETRG